MKMGFMIFQVIVSLLLVLTILVQERGSGLGSSFGSSGGFYVAKRGAEKVLFNLTIILAVLFVLSSLLYIFI